MITFRPALRQRVEDILVAAVGPGSDPQEYIKTFDKRLQDIDIVQLPLLVINVRMAEKLLPAEIGNPYQHYTWTVHIYYLDMEVDATKYDVADERRDHIVGRVEKALETNWLLPDLITNNILKTVDTDGHSEQIYSSGIQTIVFDESGQDGHQSFVSEIYFEVYTDRS